MKRAILTASGGPFYNKEDLSEVTVAEALNHPTWKMGSKITIDSATLMNKGFEVIEAHWLFGLDYKQIEVLIHPQSLAHALVEYNDGSIFTLVSPTDMKFPITYSLFYPEKISIPFETINLNQLKTLNFYEPDFKQFPMLKFAYDSGRSGGAYPAVLTGANDIAVELFLKEKIKFNQIPEIVEDALSRHIPVPKINIEILLEEIKNTRDFIRSKYGS